MIKSYFTIAWRNLLRNKLYSAINIGGLSIGMSVSFLLLLYVYNEFSFNDVHTNGGRIYKVFKNQSTEGEVHTSGITSAPLALAMQKDLPEVENVTRTNSGYDMLAAYRDINIKLTTMAADPA